MDGMSEARLSRKLKPQYDKESNPCGWNHQIDRGAGAMCYHAVGAVATSWHYFSSSEEVTEAERWLREKLTKGEVESNAYLSQWNKETKQIESVLGEFHEIGEAVDDESPALEKLRMDEV
jgi:hypothetical protein